MSKNINVVHKIQIYTEYNNPIYVGTFADEAIAEKIHKQLQDLTDKYVSYTPIPLNYKPPLFLRFFVESDTDNNIYVDLDGVIYDPSVRSVLTVSDKDYGYEGYIVVPITDSTDNVKQEAVSIFVELIKEQEEKRDE